MPGPAVFRTAASVAVITALVASCSLTPDYQRPPAPVAGQFRNAAGGGVQLAAPTTEWWKGFGCDELNGLVARALANNEDLKAAAQRVIQAQQVARQAEASLLPTLGLTGGETITAPSGGIGTAQWTGQSVQQLRTWQAGLKVSYELDLWGKNAASADSAIANAEANEFDRNAVTLSLIGDVVTNYLTILAIRDVTVIAETARDNAKSALSAIEARASIHEATQIELSQQRSTVARTESQVVSYRLQLEQTQAKLSILLGVSPSEPLGLVNTSMSAVQVPRIASGLPSDLLLRRPDIAKVEAMLRSANANIGVARAQFLPSLSLNGDGGRGAFSLASLLSPQALYYNLATSLTQMIFDGGRLKAQEKQAEARYQELVHTYSGTVLNALLEVETSLAADTLLDEQEKADLDQVKNSVEAYTLSRAAFDAGRLEYQTLLETQRTKLTSENSAALTRLARLRNSVALFKALGGDTSTPVEDPAKGKAGG